MSRINWRWLEKDYGFRFRSGAGKSKAEYYQASEPGTFYSVPLNQRKLTKERIEELATSARPRRLVWFRPRGATTNRNGTGS